MTGSREGNSRNEGSEQWRLFCAIELHASVKSLIQQRIDRLRAEAPECQASWNRAENIHLTLKFFGNIEQNNIEPITNALLRTVSNRTRFEISIGGTGAFPNHRQPRVLWIGINDPAGKLIELHEGLEQECAAAGFSKEERLFRPHLTIARIRKPTGARVAAELNQKLGFEPITLPVNELVVFRSELSSKGSKYTALSRHKMSDLL